MPCLKGTIMGINIYVVPDQVKMQLSPDCPVTEDFRKEINAWMVEFFGFGNLIKDGDIWKSPEALYTNPRTFFNLKKEMMKANFNCVNAINLFT